MSFLRDTPRKIRNAAEIDVINRVLEKYVDFKDLYLRAEFEKRPVEFLDHPDDDTLVLRFDGPLEEERIEIYTVVRERYIKFDLELVSEAEPRHPSFSYQMRIKNCSIALDKREHERIKFKEEQPAVTNMATIKVRERESDFQKSLFVKMIAEEFINKLDGVDYKKIIFKDEKELPPPVQYVIESGKTLYIKNISDAEGFFAENEAYFQETNSLALQEELHRWVMSNETSIKSVLVRPISFFPLVGNEFHLGYLSVINKDREIEAGQVERLDAFILDLSDQIRSGNLIESKTVGVIYDVSPGGARIELSDTKLIDRLATQNVMVFEMNFKENNPLLISGSIVYVYKRADGRCFVGVDFKGSRFGPRIKNVLPIHIKHFLYHKKR